LLILIVYAFDWEFDWDWQLKNGLMLFIAGYKKPRILTMRIWVVPSAAKREFDSWAMMPTLVFAGVLGFSNDFGAESQ
jgi:hypothetical protein